MNDTARQSLRPSRFEKGELVAELGGKALLQLAGPRGARLVEPPPAGKTEIIRPTHRKRGAGAVQPG